MKIIDFDKKGNLVRLYLGEDDTNDYWGDDWNDRPYEHNAGTVYGEYVSAIVDVVFPFDYIVLEPCEDWHFNMNSPYSKEDMINKYTPCIVAYKPNDDDNIWVLDNDFMKIVSMKDSIKFYFGDPMEPSDEMVIWK